MASPSLELRTQPVASRVATASIGVNVALSLLNLTIAVASGSLAVTAEMVHNLVDLAGSVAVLAGVRISERGASGVGPERHGNSGWSADRRHARTAGRPVAAPGHPPGDGRHPWPGRRDRQTVGRPDLPYRAQVRSKPEAGAGGADGSGAGSSHRQRVQRLSWPDRPGMPGCSRQPAWGSPSWGGKGWR
jgi:hypothetical protein